MANKQSISKLILVLSLLFFSISAQKQKNRQAKVLSDKNFEHDTQATTGSTTGDWLVQFCNQNDKECRNIKPMWDELADKLTGRLSVAIIDQNDGQRVFKRFSVGKTPTILFLRKKRFYQYEGDIELDKIEQFATLDYAKANHQGEIPGEPGAFEQLWKMMLIEIEENGGFINTILMKDSLGNVNLPAVVLLFGLPLMGFITICFIFNKKPSNNYQSYQGAQAAPVVQKSKGEGQNKNNNTTGGQKGQVKLLNRHNFQVHIFTYLNSSFIETPSLTTSKANQMGSEQDKVSNFTQQKKQQDQAQSQEGEQEYAQRYGADQITLNSTPQIPKMKTAYNPNNSSLVNSRLNTTATQGNIVPQSMIDSTQISPEKKALNSARQRSSVRSSERKNRGSPGSNSSGGRSASAKRSHKHRSYSTDPDSQERAFTYPCQAFKQFLLSMREGNLSIADIANQPDLLQYINQGAGSGQSDPKPFQDTLRSSSNGRSPDGKGGRSASKTKKPRNMLKNGVKNNDSQSIIEEDEEEQYPNTRESIPKKSKNQKNKNEDPKASPQKNSKPIQGNDQSSKSPNKFSKPGQNKKTGESSKKDLNESLNDSMSTDQRIRNRRNRNERSNSRPQSDAEDEMQKFLEDEPIIKGGAEITPNRYDDKGRPIKSDSPIKGGSQKPNQPGAGSKPGQNNNNQRVGLQGQGKDNKKPSFSNVTLDPNTQITDIDLNNNKWQSVGMTQGPQGQHQRNPSKLAGSNQEPSRTSAKHKKKPSSKNTESNKNPSQKNDLNNKSGILDSSKDQLNISLQSLDANNLDDPTRFARENLNNSAAEIKDPFGNFELGPRLQNLQDLDSSMRMPGRGNRGDILKPSQRTSSIKYSDDNSNVDKSFNESQEGSPSQKNLRIQAKKQQAAALLERDSQSPYKKDALYKRSDCQIDPNDKDNQDVQRQNSPSHPGGIETFVKKKKYGQSQVGLKQSPQRLDNPSTSQKYNDEEMKQGDSSAEGKKGDKQRRTRQNRNSSGAEDNKSEGKNDFQSPGQPRPNYVLPKPSSKEDAPSQSITNLTSGKPKNLASSGREREIQNQTNESRPASKIQILDKNTNFSDDDVYGDGGIPNVSANQDRNKEKDRPSTVSVTSNVSSQKKKDHSPTRHKAFKEDVEEQKVFAYDQHDEGDQSIKGIVNLGNSQKIPSTSQQNQKKAVPNRDQRKKETNNRYGSDNQQDQNSKKDSIIDKIRGNNDDNEYIINASSGVGVQYNSEKDNDSQNLSDQNKYQYPFLQLHKDKLSHITEEDESKLGQGKVSASESNTDNIFNPSPQKKDRRQRKGSNQGSGEKGPSHYNSVNNTDLDLNDRLTEEEKKEPISNQILHNRYKQQPANAGNNKLDNKNEQAQQTPIKSENQQKQGEYQSPKDRDFFDLSNVNLGNLSQAEIRALAQQQILLQQQLAQSPVRDILLASNSKSQLQQEPNFNRTPGSQYSGSQSKPIQGQVYQQISSQQQFSKGQNQKNVSQAGLTDRLKSNSQQQLQSPTQQNKEEEKSQSVEILESRRSKQNSNILIQDYSNLKEENKTQKLIELETQLTKNILQNPTKPMDYILLQKIQDEASICIQRQQVIESQFIRNTNIRITQDEINVHGRLVDRKVQTDEIKEFKMYENMNKDKFKKFFFAVFYTYMMMNTIMADALPNKK